MSDTHKIRCAYCSTVILIKLGSFEVKIRAAQIGVVKCPTCDSSFSIHVATKRKSKGKRLKSIEAKRTAEHFALVKEREAENEKIAARMLAEPGCTCAAHKPNERQLNYYNLRADGLENGGTSNGLPLPPRHRWDCPCNPHNKTKE